MDPAPRIARQEVVGAMPPPPGVIPNFEHPESRGNQVVVTIAVLLPLATLVLSLRLYTRRMIVRTMGSDDWTWNKFDWFWWLTIYSKVVNLGMGSHIWDVPLTTFSPHYLKIGMICGIFYGLSFMCVKLSILLLYLRLSPYRPFRITVWIAAAVTVIYSVLGSFEFIFNCRPIAKNWDVTISGGSCIDVAKILTAHGIVNIATDVATLVLPVMLVYKLQLPMKQKVAVAGLFMTGTLVCIVSAIRLKSVWDLAHSMDMTWVGLGVSVWSVVEVYVGIICACLISFKPFLRRHFPRLIGSSNRSGDFRARFSRTASVIPKTSISGYELESREGHRKSGIPRKSKQQTGTDNDSQEDILGDGYPKDTSKRIEVATSEVGPLSQTGSFRSNRSGIPPTSREEF
ncbi:hypothetical protein DL95DRAFT_407493 [Leptodontidium sp. 2 PMI_412]|nr:hypothetical protein DL95DRAFT_407493 [Leptodontidium sp. 2 PMI_412]